MARTITPTRSSLNRVAQKRVAWALERSGIVKLEPTEFIGVNGFGSGIRIEAFSPTDVDWSTRVESSKGAVYITNIPPGKIALKVTSDLGVFVQEITIDGGAFETISVPTNSETMDSSIEAGEVAPVFGNG